MAPPIAELTIELAAGHPGTGAYSLVDATALAELQAVNRPDDVGIAEIIKFLTLDNTHKTDGSDTQDRSIWERMKDVEALGTTPTGAVANPWGSTTLGNITEIQQVKTQQLLDYFTLVGQGNLPVDLSDSNFQSYLAGAQAAGCMSTTQETALLALGDNKQSREAEKGWSGTTVANIAEARA